ncbi:MAG: hypothetical protein V2J07_09485 [Anaerolineae bacterium]|jgi:hypothetical protein|nr:hypothetical protein [Anaerolineae bacterium]
MKFTVEAQEIFDRYLLAVERKLPLQGRKDLKAEIESNLLDSMEDNLSGSGVEEINKAILEGQLKQIGSPRSVANSYAPIQPLIGNQHDFIFRIIVTMVVPIVVIVVFFAGLLSFAFSGGANPFAQFMGIINSAWNVGIYIIGYAAVVFMLLTRFFPDVNEKVNKEFLENEMKEWDLSDLPELVEESDKAPAWEQIVGIVFGSFFLIAITVFFDRYAGLWFITESGDWVMLPILSDGVRALVPLWAVSIGLGIIHASILLYQHKRSVFSRWFAMFIKAFDLAVLTMFIRVPQYLNFDSALAIEKGMDPDGAIAFENLMGQPYFNYFLIFVLVVTSISFVVELIKTISYTVKKAQ